MSSLGSPLELEEALRLIECFYKDSNRDRENILQPTAHKRHGPSVNLAFIEKLESDWDVKHLYLKDLQTALLNCGKLGPYFCGLAAALSALKSKAKADMLRGVLYMESIKALKAGLPDEQAKPLLETLLSNQHHVPLDRVKSLVDKMILTESFRPIRPTSECLRGLGRCLEFVSKVAQRPESFVRLFVLNCLLELTWVSECVGMLASTTVDLVESEEEAEKALRKIAHYLHWKAEGSTAGDAASSNADTPAQVAATSVLRLNAANREELPALLYQVTKLGQKSLNSSAYLKRITVDILSLAVDRIVRQAEFDASLQSWSGGLGIFSTTTGTGTSGAAKVHTNSSEPQQTAVLATISHHLSLLVAKDQGIASEVVECIKSRRLLLDPQASACNPSKSPRGRGRGATDSNKRSAFSEARLLLCILAAKAPHHHSRVIKGLVEVATSIYSTQATLEAPGAWLGWDAWRSAQPMRPVDLRAGLHRLISGPLMTEAAAAPLIAYALACIDSLKAPPKVPWESLLGTVVHCHPPPPPRQVGPASLGAWLLTTLFVRCKYAQIEIIREVLQRLAMHASTIATSMIVAAGGQSEGGGGMESIEGGGGAGAGGGAVTSSSHAAVPFATSSATAAAAAFLCVDLLDTLVHQNLHAMIDRGTDLQEAFACLGDLPAELAFRLITALGPLFSLCPALADRLALSTRKVTFSRDLQCRLAAVAGLTSLLGAQLRQQQLSFPAAALAAAPASGLSLDEILALLRRFLSYQAGVRALLYERVLVLQRMQPASRGPLMRLLLNHVTSLLQNGGEGQEEWQRYGRGHSFSLERCGTIISVVRLWDRGGALSGSGGGGGGSPLVCSTEAAGDLLLTLLAFTKDSVAADAGPANPITKGSGFGRGRGRGVAASHLGVKRSLCRGQSDDDDDDDDGEGRGRVLGGGRIGSKVDPDAETETESDHHHHPSQSQSQSQHTCEERSVRESAAQLLWALCVSTSKSSLDDLMHSDAGSGAMAGAGGADAAASGRIPTSLVASRRACLDILRALCVVALELPSTALKEGWELEAQGAGVAAACVGGSEIVVSQRLSVLSRLAKLTADIVSDQVKAKADAKLTAKEKKEKGKGTGKGNAKKGKKGAGNELDDVDRDEGQLRGDDELGQGVGAKRKGYAAASSLPVLAPGASDVSHNGSGSLALLLLDVDFLTSSLEVIRGDLGEDNGHAGGVVPSALKPGSSACDCLARMAFERGLFALDRLLFVFVAEAAHRAARREASAGCAPPSAAQSLHQHLSALDEYSQQRVSLLEAATTNVASLLHRLLSFLHWVTLHEDPEVWHGNAKFAGAGGVGSVLAEMSLQQMLHRSVLGCLRVQSAARCLDRGYGGGVTRDVAAASTAAGTAARQTGITQTLVDARTAFGAAATQNRTATALDRVFHTKARKDKHAKTKERSKADNLTPFTSLFNRMAETAPPSQINKKGASDVDKLDRKHRADECSTLPLVVCILAEIMSIFDLPAKDRAACVKTLLQTCCTKLTETRAPLTQTLIEFMILSVVSSSSPPSDRIARLTEVAGFVAKCFGDATERNIGGGGDGSDDEEEVDQEEAWNGEPQPVFSVLNLSSSAAAVGSVLSFVDRAIADLEALMKLREKQFTCKGKAGKKGARAHAKGGGTADGHISSEDEGDSDRDYLAKDDDGGGIDDDDNSDGEDPTAGTTGGLLDTTMASVDIFATAPDALRRIPRLSDSDSRDRCCELLRPLLQLTTQLVAKPQPMPDGTAERVITTLTKLFRLVGRLAKQVVSSKETDLPRQFKLLAETAAGETAPTIEELLIHLHTRSSKKNKDKKSKGKKSKDGDGEVKVTVNTRLKKQSKVVPELIYQMEQLDVHFIQLAKQCKDARGFQRLLRRTQMRDFKYEENES